MTVELEMPEGNIVKEEMKFGEIKRIDLRERQEAKAVITPHKGFDVGEGLGHKIEGTVMGGIAGIMLDARGRPLYLPKDDAERKQFLLKWFDAMDLYPVDELKELA
jgi:hypothetical protein